MFECIKNENSHLIIKRLTYREKQVMLCLKDSLTNQQIAEKLFSTETRVKNILHRLSGKLECKTRVEVLNKAYALDLFTKLQEAV
jgi:DNA-binding NarL/FixJ family response regulator